MKNVSLFALVIMAGCSFKKNPMVNQTHKGHEELYTVPNAPKITETENIKRIVIAATNDVEAHYSPHHVTFKDEHNPGTQQMSIGGAEAMSAYFKILREQYKNVLLVDSGDIFSAKSEIKEVQNFYEKNKYDAHTVGLNDFNLKLPKGITSSAQLFKEYARDSSVPVLLSNLYEVKTARGVEWKGTQPYLLKNISGVKVGIIGLIPDDIVSMTPVDNRLALYVENMLTNTLRQARLLRSLGAEIIVVLTHQGINCGHEMAQESKLPLQKVNFEPTDPNACELNSALGTYLQRLPPHLIDVVVGGRNHEKMANYVNGNIVLGNFEQGKSMVYAEFFVDIKSKTVLKDRTIVHQPVMFCHEFFKKTNDCFTQDPSVDHARRIPAKFLGKDLGLIKAPDSVTNAEQLQSINFAQALIELDADIAFTPPTSKSSQLIVLQVPGKLLLNALEEDYNNSSFKNWYPSPYTQEKDGLHLMLKGETIDPDEFYSVLTDLEGMHVHRALSQALFHANSKAKTGHSWTSFETADTVKTRMAAQAR
ncbi:MAG TPA: hypothetical protein VNJ08_15930 [Bacteriovoracaceae bacterium]|nr:hypothetical protein [Bacteriovoracaceae bacterium]